MIKNQHRTLTRSKITVLLSSILYRIGFSFSDIASLLHFVKFLHSVLIYIETRVALELNNGPAS